MAVKRGVLEKNKPKVLIVDDDEALCSLLSFRFAKRGFDVARAFDGEDAIKFLNAAKFDIMLLDLVMPRMGGFGLLKALKAGDAPYPGVIIMLAAQADEADVLEAFELGAVDFVTKPFNMDVLMARIDVSIKFKSGINQVGRKQA